MNPNQPLDLKQWFADVAGIQRTETTVCRFSYIKNASQESMVELLGGTSFLYIRDVD
ncbi:hypothetical protein HMPREF0658_0233 [Hoylesella marshii DSM 16973 = JCM 13450]|uniref:Uncharacterized protein n=1 Tax=Hoylesella marshii DSM 16973 = JCM 13450 TaxID=862515 RepID=E0NPY2_9BACT|nr:hypothetical protein HMPREF0658_0233 [Hoylesella marshii DSM 16973 = JCM 13450]